MEEGLVTFCVSLPAKTPSSWSGSSTTSSSSSLSSSSSSTSSLESSSTPLQISGESQWLLIFTKIGYLDLVDDDPISILDICRLCPGLRNTIQRRSRKTHALFVVLRGKTLTTKMWLLRYNFYQASESQETGDQFFTITQDHVNKEHNMWNYLWFIVLIKVKTSSMIPQIANVMIGERSHRVHRTRELRPLNGEGKGIWCTLFKVVIWNAFSPHSFSEPVPRLVSTLASHISEGE